LSVLGKRCDMEKRVRRGKRKKGGKRTNEDVVEVNSRFEQCNGELRILRELHKLLLRLLDLAKKLLAFCRPQIPSERKEKKEGKGKDEPKNLTPLYLVCIFFSNAIFSLSSCVLGSSASSAASRRSVVRRTSGARSSCEISTGGFRQLVRQTVRRAGTGRTRARRRLVCLSWALSLLTDPEMRRTSE
jgi:hypothetical protein